MYTFIIHLLQCIFFVKQNFHSYTHWAPQLERISKEDKWWPKTAWFSQRMNSPGLSNYIILKQFYIDYTKIILEGKLKTQLWESPSIHKMWWYHFVAGQTQFWFVVYDFNRWLHSSSRAYKSCTLILLYLNKSHQREICPSMPFPQNQGSDIFRDLIQCLIACIHYISKPSRHRCQLQSQP